MPARIKPMPNNRPESNEKSEELMWFEGLVMRLYPNEVSHYIHRCKAGCHVGERGDNRTR